MSEIETLRAEVDALARQLQRTEQALELTRAELADMREALRETTHG